MATHTENSSETTKKPIGDAVEQARTPLLAALGAGDLAAQSIADALGKLRTRLNESAESARNGVGELPKDLREKLDPAELRKLLENYQRSAQELYDHLAQRGETTVERLQSQPQVKNVWSQVEQAQDRFGTAVADVRVLADDVLGKVTTATRSFGEKAAQSTEQATASAAETVRETADDVAEQVEEAGSEAATATRSTARKTANKTSAAKSGGAAKQAPKSTAAKESKPKSDS